MADTPTTLQEQVLEALEGCDQLESVKAIFEAERRRGVAVRAWYDRHVVFVREDVARSVAAFTGGLVESGYRMQDTVPLAQMHLSWLLQDGPR